MQSAIERYIKEKNYPVSIVQSRESLDAKGAFSAPAGKTKRAKQSPVSFTRRRFSPVGKGQLGDFNGRVLTYVNFKNLAEQLGLRGRQEHLDAYVEVSPKHELAV